MQEASDLHSVLLSFGSFVHCLHEGLHSRAAPPQAIGLVGASGRWPRKRHDGRDFEGMRFLRAGQQLAAGHMAVVEYRGDWSECQAD